MWGNKESDQLSKVVNQKPRVESMLNSAEPFVGAEPEAEVHALCRRRFLGESLTLQKPLSAALLLPAAWLILRSLVNSLFSRPGRNLMGTGSEEGAVWGIQTKWYRPGQNDKLGQPESGPSKNGLAWSFQIFHRRFGNC